MTQGTACGALRSQRYLFSYLHVAHRASASQTLCHQTHELTIHSTFTGIVGRFRTVLFHVYLLILYLDKFDQHLLLRLHSTSHLSKGVYLASTFFGRAKFALE
jgi:hypothetical protein